MIEPMKYKKNDNVKITYLDTLKVVFGTVVGYEPDGLRVDRVCKGLGWVPVGHPNVKIEIIDA